MAFSDLFDGQEHWLELGVDWSVPHLTVGAVVEMLAEGEWDALEGPAHNLVAGESPASEKFFTGKDQGWSALAIMLQGICEILDLPSVIEQHVHRSGDWKVTGSEHLVQIGVLKGLSALDEDDPDVVVSLDLPEGL